MGNGNHERSGDIDESVRYRGGNHHTRSRPRRRKNAQQSLSVLVASGIPVAASDGGSPNRFVDRLRHLPNLTLAKRGNSLVRQVRASVAEAHKTGRPFILYTEPTSAISSTVALPISSSAPRSLVLSASSSPLIQSALTTFPPFQRLAEASASELCHRTIGADTDYFYGPFLVRRELARLVFSASDDLGWGWRPFLFVTASRLGHRVVGIPGDYECPRDQRSEHYRDTEHRLRQFTDNVRGLLDGVVEKRSAVGPRV